MPLKRVASFRAGSFIDSEAIDVSGSFPVFGGNGLRGYTETYTHEGDFVLVGRQGALCGNVNYASGRFYATEHAVVVRPLDGVHVRWLGGLLRSLDLGRYSRAAAQPGLAVDVIENLRVSVPSYAHQQAIAAFLDAETANIERLIGIRRRQITLLAERTESLIASLLDPLIASYGEAPLKVVADVRLSSVDKAARDGEIPVQLCNYTDVYYNWTIDKDLTFMEATATPEEVRRFTLREGDVLLTKDSETPDDIGIASVVTMDLPGVVAGYHLALVRPRSIDGRFLGWALRSRRCRDSFTIAASGVTRFGLRQDAIARVPVPNLDGRSAASLVSEVERQVGSADALSRYLRKQVNLLVERSHALTTAAITGQLDMAQTTHDGR